MVSAAPRKCIMEKDPSISIGDHFAGFIDMQVRSGTPRRFDFKAFKARKRTEFGRKAK